MPRPQFTVVPGAAVAEILRDRHGTVIDLVRSTYLAHGAGRTVNPPSQFLRFPGRPGDRIIALPATLDAEAGISGLKWISSYPGNRQHGLPRASAVLILNDPETGFPVACLEGSRISAARTAASAALAAEVLAASRGPRPRRLGIIGAGLIAETTYDYLAATGWTFDELHVYDRSPIQARAAAHRLGARVHNDIEPAIRSSDLIVFATTAGQPHVHDPTWFNHHPLVLHVSLRDLAPEIILSSANILDDLEHCLREGTSVHLAEQASGDRTFITGTLHDILVDSLRVAQDRTVVFSPFGLGILDLAVGEFVYREGIQTGQLTPHPDFFALP